VIFNLTLSSWPVATRKKKDRSDFAGGPSLGRKDDPGKGQRQGDTADYPRLRIEQGRALTTLNFRSTLMTRWVDALLRARGVLGVVYCLMRDRDQRVDEDV
jgi:hypothetical protein